MARSSYIYIIKRGEEIDSAFTVKYEMENYLERNESLHDCWTQVFRIKDGGEGKIVELTEDYHNYFYD